MSALQSLYDIGVGGGTVLTGLAAWGSRRQSRRLRDDLYHPEHGWASLFKAALGELEAERLEGARLRRALRRCIARQAS